MKISSVSRKLILSIVLLLYGDQLTAEKVGVCKKKQSHDVYVPLNDVSCERDVSDNKSFIIKRYRPAKKCTSDFDATGILSLVFISLITIATSQ
ncbi:hypothetical protein ALC62_01301 [Cyphomyrmex costatus]|uniref:Uncharacterized protein n=1 Tax=Cyphomyrmex costatus TaxID=456900 RepID=A0A195D4G1_9HYME|nr:hypothetical protein ALC62_01301 [Cyphomyrmex costatus]